MSDGKYCGHNSIVRELRLDTFDVWVGNKIQSASRWAMCVVDQGMRNSKMAKETDQNAQFARTHCGATAKSGELETVPAKELAIDHRTHRPVIGVRVFHGGPSAALNHLAYYYHHGYVRCNQLKMCTWRKEFMHISTFKLH